MVLTVEGGASTDCCCCTCKLNVPSGVHILEQHWGKDSGKIRPGVHWCYCCNKRVVYILPIGGIFYDAPVPDCPTRDNVKVSINASMMLKIGSTDLDQRNFMYIYIYIYNPLAINSGSPCSISYSPLRSKRLSEIIFTPLNMIK